MDAMCIPNMSHRKDITTTLGTVKGEALPLVDRTMLADNRKRLGRLHIEGYLAARMWIIVYTAAACLPDLSHQDLPRLPNAGPARQPLVSWGRSLHVPIDCSCQFRMNSSALPGRAQDDT